MRGTKIFVWNREMFEIWKFEDKRENMTGINQNGQSTKKDVRGRERSSGET